MALAQANMITQCQYDLEAHLDDIIMATYRGGGNVLNFLLHVYERVFTSRWRERRHLRRRCCTRGPIWVHARVDMGSREWAIMGLEPRAVSARITNYFVTIYI